MTDEEIWKLKKELQEETLLSPQEARIVALMTEKNRQEICNEMDISVGQFDSIKHGRIPKKFEHAENTVEMLEGRLFIPEENVADTDAHALVGCSGPDCPEDVDTATRNPLFNDYYSKTINVHSDDRRQGFERTLHFCSVECLQEYNRHL